nr:SPOR domain-containing protein [uncultured Bacteroides sp.]
MIELAQHIEALLLENDCVIVPGFGGFVAHYASATWIADECIFLPPTRTIGFNPQLKMNDGLLVQSYMATYETNFSDASKTIDKKVEELISLLHEDGKADLDNIGELHFTIHGTYEFTPYDNKITTPYLYGLDAVTIKPLDALQNRPVRRKPTSPFIPAEKKTYDIRINRSFLRSAVAVAAAIALFFVMSTPVENTYVEKTNYAQLLPADLFEKIEKQSLAITPVMVKGSVTQTSVNAKKHETTKKETKPRAVKEIMVPKAINKETLEKKEQAVGIAKPSRHEEEKVVTNAAYHIIVASSIGSKDAENLAEQLRAKGYPNAKALISAEMVRVSLMACPTREEAGKHLTKIRQNEAFENAWVLTPAK